jgi:hypothetical protein
LQQNKIGPATKSQKNNGRTGSITAFEGFEMAYRPVLSILFSALLVGCGSGGNSGPDPVVGGASTDQPAPSGGTTPPAPSTPTTPSSPSNPGTTPAPAPFSAAVTRAPANNAIVIGRVLLEVRGVGLENVELLPGSGATPIYATFVISEDKTSATADIDIRSLPDGPLVVRISAFDAPAGTNNAREIVAMAPRTWNVLNTPPHSIFFPGQACLAFIATTNGGLPEPSSGNQTEENGTQRLTYSWSNGFTRVFTWQTGQNECVLASESGTPPPRTQ